MSSRIGDLRKLTEKILPPIVLLMISESLRERIIIPTILVLLMKAVYNVSRLDDALVTLFISQRGIELYEYSVEEYDE